MRSLSVEKVNDLYDRNTCHLGPDFANAVLRDIGIEYTVLNKDCKLSLLSRILVIFNNVELWRNLRTQAKRIKTDIERLKVKQEGLKMAKDEKENLKSEISALRRILENTPGASKEIFGGVGELMMVGRFVDEVASAHREGVEDLGLGLYEIFSRSKDRLSLDYNLFARNFSCDPVFHSNGGVADLKIISTHFPTLFTKLNNRGNQKVLK